MKRKLKLYCPIFLAFLLLQMKSFAQLSCNSGKVDPLVAPILKYFPPEMTLEQERVIPLEDRRKFGSAEISKVPKDKMKTIRITQDSIGVLVFYPDRPSAKQLPVIINFHGGAFVAPLLPWMYNIGYSIANNMNAIVFDVDYRVAPEHQFPVPVHDCYNSFKWVLAHAKEFGGDPDRLMITGGSSGANLAAVVCQLAKADGLSKKIKAVWLFCPVVDNLFTSIYPSLKENATGYGLTLNGCLWAFENYTGENLKDPKDPRMFPINAKSFEGLPPTLVITAEFDPLRDQGEAYYKKLKSAGVTTKYRCFPGELHTFMGLPPEGVAWKQLDDEVKSFIAKIL